MDVREKLVELLCEAQHIVTNTNKAEYLVEHGVTVHENVKMSDELLKQLKNAPITICKEEPSIELVQEWISVKDRLPEQPPNRVDEQGRSWFTPDIDCIVYDGENVFAANYCFQNKCFWYTNSLEPLNNITHWMPLPQPPKGE